MTHKVQTASKFFHIVSYLQYPLIIVALILYFPLIKSFKNGLLDWELANYILILFGVGLSFSTLQDTTKTQNKISEKVWSDPLKGKIMLIFLSIMAFLFIIAGLVMLFYQNNSLQEGVSIGLIVLGIGLIGVLKGAIEMYEHHRSDKN